MQYCKRCLYPANHPLKIVFDEEGICSGCRVHEEKDRIDWALKSVRLKAILDDYKNLNGNNYDCIIPVSGGRDSYFIVHLIKSVYGMNPLLVTYNKHYNTDLGIRNLAYLRSHFNCDLMTMTVSPEKVKKITRATLRKFGSMYWHCIAGQTVFPVQIAVKLKIPLIIWGCHQGIDQVGMYSHDDEVEMTRKYRKEHDLMGYEAEDLIDVFDDLDESDLIQYFYPNNNEIAAVGVRGIYLNNFIRWDTKLQHETMLDLYNYETSIQQRTFDKYNDVDCFHYSGLHDKIKYMKFGYSKVTDHATREIRFGRLTRNEGIRLVKEYSTIEPKDVGLFCDWLGIKESSLFFVLDQHRSTDIWEKDEGYNGFKLKDTICDQYDDSLGDQPVDVDIAFRETKPKKLDFTDDQYILIGKGYVN